MIFRTRFGLDLSLVWFLCCSITASSFRPWIGWTMTGLFFFSGGAPTLLDFVAGFSSFRLSVRSLRVLSPDRHGSPCASFFSSRLFSVLGCCLSSVCARGDWAVKKHAKHKHGDGLGKSTIKEQAQHDRRKHKSEPTSARNVFFKLDFGI